MATAILKERVVTHIDGVTLELSQTEAEVIMKLTGLTSGHGKWSDAAFGIFSALSNKGITYTHVPVAGNPNLRLS